MKKWLNIAILTCMALRTIAASATDSIPDLRLSGRQQYIAVVFLSTDCPLSQNYTSVVNQLSAEYKEKVAFYGVIPGKSASAQDIERFRTEYHIAFNLLPDRQFRLTRLLKATTTPQAFLLSGQGATLYGGLIDNWAVSLGVQRSITTEHYLKTAIDASLLRLPITVRQTRPVGCLINTK
jgi:hypothetical protein